VDHPPSNSIDQAITFDIALDAPATIASVGDASSSKLVFAIANVREHPISVSDAQKIGDWCSFCAPRASPVE
jgi:hypothetical protein